MSDQDPQDELWKLMGRARRPSVSPFFARNVVRQIRLQEKPVRVFTFWRLLATSTAAVAVVAAFLFSTSDEPVGSAAKSPDPPVEDIVASPDYEVIAELDELFAYERNAIWLDTTSTF